MCSIAILLSPQGMVVAHGFTPIGEGEITVGVLSGAEGIAGLVELETVEPP